MEQSTLTLREAVDAEACREAELITRHRELTGARCHGRMKHWEFRNGLEKLEARRRFNNLFKGGSELR